MAEQQSPDRVAEKDGNGAKEAGPGAGRPGVLPVVDFSTGDVFFTGSGTEVILRERTRQKIEEEYDNEHDDGHTDESLAMAAACYAYPGRIYARRHEDDSGIILMEPWPLSWAELYDKRRSLQGVGRDRGGGLLPHHQVTMTERIDLLGKSGALIAAEIDRWRRLVNRLPLRLAVSGDSEARAGFHMAVAPYLIPLARSGNVVLYAAEEDERGHAVECARAHDVFLARWTGQGWAIEVDDGTHGIDMAKVLYIKEKEEASADGSDDNGGEECFEKKDPLGRSSGNEQGGEGTEGPADPGRGRQPAGEEAK